MGDFRAFALAALIAAILLLPYAASGIPASKYRDTSDPMFGKIIFGTSLPYGEEDKFAGVGTSFTWGQFNHLEARCYFPRTFGEVTADLLDEVTAKGIFIRPYVYSNGWELWIDKMDGDKVGEQIAYAGTKIEDIEGSDDQLMCWLWDEDDGSDIYRVPGKSYPDGVGDFPFPEACLLKPGKYHVQVQYYVQVKGETGGGDWKYSGSGGGTWAFFPAEGFINVGIAGGEFTLTVP